MSSTPTLFILGKRRSDASAAQFFTGVYANSRQQHRQAANQRFLTNAYVSQEQCRVVMLAAQQEMRTDAHANAEHGSVANVKQGSIDDDDARGPINQRPNPRPPHTQPRGIQARRQPQQLLQERKPIEKDMQLAAE